jgi:hypothetical protein
MADDLDLLEQLAAGLEDDPNFMAWALAHFRAQENLPTSEALSERLGISRRFLVRLGLCTRPESNSPDFAVRVRELADFAAIDVIQLATILRQVEFVERVASAEDSSDKTIRFPGSTHRPLLAAARDRVEPLQDTNTPLDASEETR